MPLDKDNMRYTPVLVNVVGPEGQLHLGDEYQSNKDENQNTRVVDATIVVSGEESDQLEYSLCGYSDNIFWSYCSICSLAACPWHKLAQKNTHVIQTSTNT